MIDFKRATDLLDKAVCDVPDKIGFVDAYGEMTYRQMYEASMKVAKAIVNANGKTFTEDPQPIVTIFETSNELVASMHGVLYAGDFFTCIDETMPNERIEKIFDTLRPVGIITNRKNEEKTRSLNYDGIILVFEEIMEAPEEGIEIPKITSSEVSTNLACMVFTSGSTGTPKGVMMGHSSIIYNAVGIRDNIDIIFSDHVGNQSSMYYALGIIVMFASMAAQATCYLIPKPLFSEPGVLAKYLVDNRISAIIWVASGVSMLSRFESWEGYEDELNNCLRSVTFAGEVAPTKLINKMKKAIPNPKYCQYYGATEFMFTSYYIMERDIDDSERIPVGFPTEFVNVYIIKDDGTEAKDGEEGQICLGGPGIGLGYYKDEVLTSEKFQDNPLKTGEKIYMSGDIVEKNKYGEMIFKGRKDNLIKRMGHRIELGEIEIAACALDDKMHCACIFDKEKEHIIMYFAGIMDTSELRKKLREKIPQYMLPNKFIKLDELPHNQNNKVDRKKLQELYF